ncbi:L-rhamnose mutarotase [Rhodococcoides yunnanense]|uniref:L-rhamnose mutarotase n=1 Tax=Rhodococcoides yunnanense TaxID=278209 RepID=UPI000932ED6B|nr:L-rhamnose mutarotase [Rhodococcus yunnanensis]
MSRYCFTLQLRPESVPEYSRRHAEVWPEMLEALKASDWNNYSLHIRDDGLIVGYVESTDLDAAQRAMSSTEVNARWQAEMSPFFAGLADTTPDEGFVLLRELFHLESQLGNQS